VFVINLVESTGYREELASLVSAEIQLSNWIGPKDELWCQEEAGPLSEHAGDRLQIELVR
jgi:hypothetical protein